MNRLNKVITVLIIGFVFLSGEKMVWAGQDPFEDPYGYKVYFATVSTPRRFLDTFDGDPERPKPWNPAEWDVAVHSRDVDTWDKLEKMDAAHANDCSPAPATHAITEYQDVVYQCRGHIMTAINASGYGVIYLTPNQLVDFSDGEAVIRFDMSTARTSGRDWIDVWITPYEDNLQLPLTDWLPDLSGEPREAVQVEMNFSEQKTGFSLNIINNFKAAAVQADSWIGYEDYLTPSAMRRDTFELRISKTHVKFGMPEYNLWWVDKDIPALDWSKGVVQFGHHSYNPDKDCNGCKANTWHWDNVEITPAIPFTIIPANRRYVNAQTQDGFRLAAPAPKNAHARFSAVSKNLQVSFDQGKTWKTAQPQAQERYDEGPFWSYWMPVPVGTTQILFQGQNWWGGNWRVKDLSVWSLSLEKE